MSVRKLQPDDCFVSCAGSPIRDLYSPVVRKDGTIVIEKSGEENFDDFIQSNAESCDIRTIVRRFQNGDINALSQVRGAYGDFTEIPKTYAEVLQMQIDVKNAFANLPREVKEKFGNDVNQFLSSAGDDDWYEKMKSIIALENNTVLKESNEVADT